MTIPRCSQREARSVARFSRLRPLAVLAAWGYAGLALLGIALWLCGWDSSNSFLIYATVYAPFLLLPAYPLLGVGIARRSVPFAIVCGVLVLAQLATVRVVVVPGASVARGPVVFRLLDANLQHTNRDTAALAASIARNKPTVITLEELSNTSIGPLEATLSAYPYHVERIRGGTGIGLYSKLPLSDTSFGLLGRNPIIHATVTAGTKHIAMLVLHTTAPRPGQEEATWRNQFRELPGLVKALPADAIVVGDFNATMLNRPLRHVLSVGHLQDAALGNGVWWPRTWARNMHVVPPLIEIDHLLVGRGAGARSFHVISDPGSDHQAIWADVTSTN
jgi:endonuclease/exonuclease/phosphatase (EEP) superfamily protein YafD